MPGQAGELNAAYNGTPQSAYVARRIEVRSAQVHACQRPPGEVGAEQAAAVEAGGAHRAAAEERPLELAVLEHDLARPGGIEARRRQLAAPEDDVVELRAGEQRPRHARALEHNPAQPRARPVGARELTPRP